MSHQWPDPCGGFLHLSFIYGPIPLNLLYLGLALSTLTLYSSANLTDTLPAQSTTKPQKSEAAGKRLQKKHQLKQPLLPKYINHQCERQAEFV